ncbi:putative ribosomal protein L35 [Medicago truncatula]|uniref:50S ribosomal protein L35 n=1 Tax=Medicago truncatula TaxID=3880 RepID=B7FGY3_MEDTR|nr:50S ribosomal protein L35, chloroplastic [Medicago truncatula]ACJ84012.1 unknown [Medicago truncatula]AES92460.1 50S ribosomal protein L35 [Medicago truncatula]AFK35744.1 unknown [Medicago truncatula]RHN64850.1 putative ribosomal protein L35 [Medicago truncatula]
MALASATATVSSFAALRLSPPSTSTRVSFSSVKSPFSNNVNSLKLNWSCSISAPILNQNHSIVTTSPRSLTIVSAKGYKMKTHKASAKRFRVTGAGKIVRRRAGKQHLLYKKNKKRKLRLSKMIQVNRSDYDNVIGALPYLKVNRKAT